MVVFFVSLCVGTAAIAAVLLVLGGMAVRAGTPPEDTGSRWAGDAIWQTDRQLQIFERELIVDAGTVLINISNLIIVASVIASVAIGFPNYWRISLITYFLSLLPAGWMALWSLKQMRIKRSRQQNIFELLPAGSSTDPVLATGNAGQPIRSAREYWLDRDPSFSDWPSAPKFQRTIMLVKQVVIDAKRYFPVEQMTEKTTKT